jgi:hypothetical protein
LGDYMLNLSSIVGIEEAITANMAEKFGIKPLSIFRIPCLLEHRG